ncbi:thioredoxin domain-containing protein [uncultured Amnibacterium sp.]|uniref:thioredoxin domain-containing protein n=1 Tax=uncultured Amnibacterium sp. TaxID=1631851 RepID=UPI0035CBD1D3
MSNRLAQSLSPYLRSHADNPVDWYPWGEAAFAEAARRDVPVLVSIGYSTCHWCHVMARESFSDPALAASLNARFVAVKVDREEHPEVDAAYLAAAGAFTQHLGWPLNVFVTPAGRAFYAGTYSPPRAVAGQPSFAQVLNAVAEAWTQRRDQVEGSAAQVIEALRAAAEEATDAAGTSGLAPADFARIAQDLVGFEDPVHGGFGGAPKFPVAPVLLLALALDRSPLVHGVPLTNRSVSGAARPDEPTGAVGDVATRALTAIRDGGLRDPVEGGFFRYATRRDWSEPHYERMLTDNALLLRAYAEAGDRATAAGVVRFLDQVLRRREGGFGSAQDSESTVDGVRVEGDYYGLDAAARAGQPPPAVDGKVLTGWNGLAIGALAHAGALLGDWSWVALAADTADALLARHRGPDGLLIRASLDGAPSTAAATLEDYGLLADGLLDLALAAGRPEYAVAARELVTACSQGAGFAVPGGGDATLAAFGLSAEADLSEGAAPSGLSGIARAAWRLWALTGDAALDARSRAAIAPHLQRAIERPIGSAALLGLALQQAEPLTQLVVVSADREAPLAQTARGVRAAVTAVVDEAAARAFAAAGFELFEGRSVHSGTATAYLCRDFVCRLPITDPRALAAAG